MGRKWQPCHPCLSSEVAAPVVVRSWCVVLAVCFVKKGKTHTIVPLLAQCCDRRSLLAGAVNLRERRPYEREVKSDNSNFLPRHICSTMRQHYAQTVQFDDWFLEARL